MALLIPLGTLTQRFGLPAPSVVSYEPAGYYSGSTKFFWSKFPSASFAYHYHPGLDYAGALNTPLPAVESGTVVEAGWAGSINGYHVVVQIKSGTKYGYSHLNGNPPVGVGWHVNKGATIGRMGASGAVTGIHTHFYLEIWEKGSDGISRTMIYNPSLFYAGAALANDPRIQPAYVAPPAATRAILNGNGINIRESAGTIGSYTLAAVYASSASGVVRRRSDGADLGHWVKPGTQTTAFSLFKRGATHGLAPYPDQWAAVWCGSAYRAVARPLVTVS